MNEMRSNDNPATSRGRERGWRPWLVALGFLLAFAATVVTVLFTGLMLGR
jgi:hypothetical protein